MDGETKAQPTEGEAKTGVDPEVGQSHDNGSGVHLGARRFS
jgi:hypothetical protein